MSGNSGVLVLQKTAAGLRTVQCLKCILATLETEPLDVQTPKLPIENVLLRQTCLAFHRLQQ